MAIEKVRDYFKNFGLEDKIQEFNVSSATVELASKALNCEPCRIAKSLSFKIEDSAILIICAGDAVLLQTFQECTVKMRNRLYCPVCLKITSRNSSKIRI